MTQQLDCLFHVPAAIQLINYKTHCSDWIAE